MRKLWLLACLLVILPLELSAKHVVRHRTARAQGCAVGQTPPTTGCGIGDMSVGGALSSTDAIAICQQAGGCPASASTWQLTKVPLMSSIRGVLSAAAPIVYNASTGQFSCPTCGTGGVTIPTAQLLGGNGTTLGGITVGSGLSLSGTFGSQTLTATGTSFTIPNAPLTSGNGTALGSVALGSNLALTGTFPTQTLQGAPIWTGTVTGTNAYTATSGRGNFANIGNNMFCGTFPNASTSAAAVTLAVDSASALPIHVQASNSTTALAGAGDIPGGVNLCLQIDPTSSFWVKTTLIPGRVIRDPSSYTVSSVDWATGATVIFTGAVAPTVTFPAVAGTLSPGGGITVVAAPGANVTFTPNAADGINGLPINTPAISNGGLSMTITSTGVAGLGALTIPLGETKIYPFSWGPGMNLSTVPIPLLTRGANTPANLGVINCTPGGLVPTGPAIIDIYMAADNVAASAVVASGTKLTATSCDATVNSGKLQTTLQITTGTGVIPAGNHLWVVASGAGWAGTLTGISGEIQVGVSP